jgi:hypothetical protein
MSLSYTMSTRNGRSYVTAETATMAVDRNASMEKKTLANIHSRALSIDVSEPPLNWVVLNSTAYPCGRARDPARGC